MRSRGWHDEPGPIAPRKRFGNYLDHLILDSIGYGISAIFGFALISGILVFIACRLWDDPFWVILLVIALVGGFLIFEDLRH